MTKSNYPYVAQAFPRPSPFHRVNGKNLDWWTERTCGIACVQSVLLNRTQNAPSLFQLLVEGVNIGAYCDKGWIHKGLATLLQSYGVTAIAQPISASVIKKSISDSVFICSVTHRLPLEGHKGGHLMLLTNLSDNNAFFMDPSSWGRHNSSIAEKRFFASYTGNCIKVKRL